MNRKIGSLWHTNLIVDPEARIELLYTTMLINQKARNVCQLNGIYTLNELVSHYLIKGSFMDLSSCGIITNRELADYVQKVLEQNPLPFRQNLDAHPLTNRLKALNGNEPGELFDKYVKLLVFTFPQRICNALNTVFADPDAVFNSKVWFLLKDKPDEIDNIGSISVNGVTKFVKRAMDYLKTLEDDYRKAVLQYLTLVFKTYYGIDQPKDYFHSYKNKIYFTPILKEALKSNKITAGKYFRVLEEYMQIYDVPISENTDNFFEKIEITNERLRQILLEMPNRIRKVFTPLQEQLPVIKNELPPIYFPEQNCLRINSNMLASLPALDRGTLNVKGLTLYIFGLNDKYAGIYPQPDAGIHDEYLLYSKKLHSLIVPSDLIKSLRTHINKKRDSTIRLDLKSLLNVWPEESEACYSSFLILLNALMDREFGLKLIDKHFIELPRNSKKLQWEYVKELLEESGTPMHLTDLYKKLKASDPEIFNHENQVRSAILRKRDVFFAVGKSSTYGLNAWKNSSKTIKSEPIVEIVHEFLKKSDTPRHHYDITRYVRIYRNSSELSIINILKLDETERFRFLAGGFIGLHDKVYSQFGLRINNAEPDTEAMIIHMVQDSGPVNKIELINKAANKYGLATVQVELILENALNKKIIQEANDFLF